MTKIKRILSEPPRDNTWLDYHREMQTKYSYLVTFVDRREPYYTDADLSDILSSETGYFEVRNNGWRDVDWNTTPRVWRAFDDDLVEIYHDEKGREIGAKQNGQWTFKQFYNDNPYVYFMRDCVDGYAYGSVGNATVVRQSNGKWQAGNSTRLLDIKSVPDEQLLQIARRLNAEHRRGFYEDDIEWMIGLGAFRRTDI